MDANNTENLNRIQNYCKKKPKHTHIYIYNITIIILSIQTHCPGNDIYIENTFIILQFSLTKE